MLSLITLFEIFNYCPKIKNKFLIHKHIAKRAGLHYDLRVEHDCVLKSWATKKMPDLISGESKKIILFQQPDHDPDWFDFEGDIDDGYGAGKVEIWDKGTFQLIKWEDHKIINFAGSKIKGKYAIIPYQVDKDQYLMFKMSNP